MPDVFPCGFIPVAEGGGVGGVPVAAEVDAVLRDAIGRSGGSASGGGATVTDVTAAAGAFSQTA